MDDLLTTRQLQDLLRVDRITIYRMLNDGRLRGFKVGGQWRFSRREVEVWLQEMQARPGRLPSPAWEEGSSRAVPSQMLPMTCVEAIQAVCAEALDIAVVTAGLDGTPLASVSNSCSFCTLILTTEAGRRRCAESWRRQPDGQFYSCHAGLLCVSLPILVEGQAVAIAAACQFTNVPSNGSHPAWQPPLSALGASLDLPEADLRARVGSVRVMEEDDLPRVSRLLGRATDAFSEMWQERLNLVSRLAKIAEMSRL